MKNLSLKDASRISELLSSKQKIVRLINIAASLNKTRLEDDLKEIHYSPLCDQAGGNSLNFLIETLGTKKVNQLLVEAIKSDIWLFHTLTKSVHFDEQLDEFKNICVEELEEAVCSVDEELRSLGVDVDND